MRSSPPPNGAECYQLEALVANVAGSATDTAPATNHWPMPLSVPCAGESDPLVQFVAYIYGCRFGAPVFWPSGISGHDQVDVARVCTPQAISQSACISGRQFAGSTRTTPLWPLRLQSSQAAIPQSKTQIKVHPYSCNQVRIATGEVRIMMRVVVRIAAVLFLQRRSVRPHHRNPWTCQ